MILSWTNAILLGLHTCYRRDVGFLCLRVNFPTCIACLSWVAGLPFWEHAWLFHGFCWAINHSFIPHCSLLDFDQVSHWYYLFPNNNWLCRIPQIIFPQLVGSAHTFPLKMLLGLPSCQQLVPVFPSVGWVAFCLESQKKTASRGFFSFLSDMGIILMLTSEWAQANGKQNCHKLFAINLHTYFLMYYRIQWSLLKPSIYTNFGKWGGKDKWTKWKSKVFSLKKMRKKTWLIWHLNNTMRNVPQSDYLDLIKRKRVHCDYW